MGGFEEAGIEREPSSCAGVLEATYVTYGDQVRRFALWRCRDESEADDIVQDAFLRLYIELVAGRPPADPRAWLCRVVANLIVSRSRHERVVRRCAPSLLAGTTASSEDVALRHDADRALAHALSGLRREEREVLLLAASGLRGPEIARRVGRSHAAVRALLCRARHHLREAARPTEPDEMAFGLAPLLTISEPTPAAIVT